VNNLDLRASWRSRSNEAEKHTSNDDGDSESDETESKPPEGPSLTQILISSLTSFVYSMT
jgi:hypothetical protein